MKLVFAVCPILDRNPSLVSSNVIGRKTTVPLDPFWEAIFIGCPTLAVMESVKLRRCDDRYKKGATDHTLTIKAQRRSRGQSESLVQERHLGNKDA